MEMDDFEAKRLQVLENLKGIKRGAPSGTRKFNLQERLQEAVNQDRLNEKAQQEAKKSGEILGLLTISDKVKDYVEREGDRVGQFKIFNHHDALAEWAEGAHPRIIILDIDPPVEDKDTFNVFSFISMASPQTKICVLTDRSRKQILTQLSKKGLLAVLNKPIQLMELKHILSGNIPIDCRPPV